MKTVVEIEHGSHRTAQILRGILRIQTDCDFGEDPGRSFARLLEILIEATGSESGFLGEVVAGPAGIADIRVRAAFDVFPDLKISGIHAVPEIGFLDFFARDQLIREFIDASRPFISEDRVGGQSLYGKIISDAGATKFLGFPLQFRDQLTGVIGLVNCAGGFGSELLDALQPLLRTAGTAIATCNVRHGAFPARSTPDQNSQLTPPETTELEEPAWFTTAAHDFRAPLNAVSGVLSLLGDGRLASRDDELVQVAKDAINSLLLIVEDTLDFAKIQAGKLEINHGAVTVAWTVDSVMQLLAVRASRAGIHLSSFIAADAPAMVTSDCARLRQILVNLVDNAITHSRAKHVSVSVERKGSTGIRFIVTDDGIGISERDQSGLFEEFQQGSSSQQGSGLGLTIARRLVDLLGGEIGFTSSEKSGSSFWFTIDAPLAENWSDQPGITREFSSVKILVVTENAPLLNSLCQQLAEWGAMVQGVASIDDPEVGQFVRAVRGGEVVLLPTLRGTDPGEVLAPLRSRGIRIIWLRSVGEIFQDHPEAQHDLQLVLPVRQIQLRCQLSRSTGRAGGALKRHYTPESVRSLLPSQGVRVLLVEDSYAGRMVGENMLLRYGFQAGSVANGMEAVEAMTASHYDIVVMDLNMPVMDGLEATRRIRALQGSKGKIPVIGITERPSAEQEKEWRALGVSGLITKPITGGSIMDELLRWIPDDESAVVPGAGQAGPLADLIRVDLGVLQQLKQDSSEELMPEMVSVFIQELSERIGTISAAAQLDELDVIARESHALINSARVFGAIAVVQIVDRLSEASHQQNKPYVKQLAEQLEAECGATIGVLQELLVFSASEISTGGGS